MLHLTATTQCESPPAWALLQRQLISAFDQSVHPFLETFTQEDGFLKWDGKIGGSPDDFYEASFNWPLLYVLGGGDHLVELGQRQWEAVTRQLTQSGLVHREYAAQEDQFHQSESDISFYLQCLAAPGHEANIERARRFAGLYMGEDPEAPNFDPHKKVIRSPVNGSNGPNLEVYGKDHTMGYSPGGMERYGMPFYDIPGVKEPRDLQDPERARLMGRAMHERMRRGDAVPNLAISSLVTNAYLLTGEEKYRQWVLDYVEVWMQRAKHNGGLLPDNVGLGGEVGEYTDGKWYGALYGWTWPHGFYNIQMVAQVAAANAYLLTQDAGYLELPRRQMDRIVELGEVRDVRREPMSLPEHWIGQFRALGENSETFLVPYRHGATGWFDWQPMSPIFPVALWSLSMDAKDWQRIEYIRGLSHYNWNKTIPFHSKEDAGHEQPWVRFLDGENPRFPEEMLLATYAEMSHRLAQIRVKGVETHNDVHVWQETNPVSTEALVQLTLGAPQMIYNGGLMLTRLRYFDAERRRPGLPEGVAALVESLEAERTVVRLVNTSAFAAKKVLIQAGMFGEHHFTEVRYRERISDYPAPVVDYAPGPLQSEERRAEVNGRHLQVEVPAGMEICLELGTKRFVNGASAGLPW